MALPSCVDSFLTASSWPQRLGREQRWNLTASFKFASKSPITLDLQVITAVIPPGPGDCNDVSDDGNEKWMLRLEFAGRGEF